MASNDKGVAVSGWMYVPELEYPVPVKRVFVNATGTGDTAVVSAVADRRIRVLSFSVIATLLNTVHFRGATTPISATMPIAAAAASGGYVRPHEPHGWFQTAVGVALNVNMSVATATGVDVTYIEVP